MSANACDGKARDHQQGFVKPCPVKENCWLHRRYQTGRKDLELLPVAPYDFEDNQCGCFRRID